jgi:acyl carrier protein
MTQDQFLELLTNWVRSNKQTSESFQITPDTELLGSGLLDSFDFLDLIVHIESQTGRKIDLAVADPNEFSLVRGLWNLALSNGGPKSDQNATDRKTILPAGITS